MDPWGEGLRQTTVGLIVDLCANCAGLQPHWVCEEHSTAQIAHINLDRGVYERTLVVCRRCSVRAEVDPARYPYVIDSENASSVALSEGLSRTNPTLKKALDALEAARNAHAPLEVLEEAEAVLFAKRDVSDAIAGLAGWATLTSEERTRVIARVHGDWQVAGGPERRRIATQPGERSFFTPTRPASILRSIDRSAVLVALLSFTLVALLVFATPFVRKRDVESASVEPTSSGSSPYQPPDELAWVDIGLTALSFGTFLTFLVWRRIQRKTIDDLRKKAGID